MPGLTNLTWLEPAVLRALPRRYSARPPGGTDARRGLPRQSRPEFLAVCGPGDHRHPIHFGRCTRLGDARVPGRLLARRRRRGAFSGRTTSAVYFWPRNDEALTRWIQFGAARLRACRPARQQDLDRRPWLFRRAVPGRGQAGVRPAGGAVPVDSHRRVAVFAGAEPPCVRWVGSPAAKTPTRALISTCSATMCWSRRSCLRAKGLTFVATRACGSCRRTPPTRMQLAGAVVVQPHDGEHVVVPAASPDGRYAWIGRRSTRCRCLRAPARRFFLQPATTRMSGVAAEPTLIVRLFPPATVGPEPGDATLRTLLYEDDGGKRRVRQAASTGRRGWLPPGHPRPATWRLHLEVAGTVALCRTAAAPPDRDRDRCSQPERTDLGLRHPGVRRAFDASVPMDAAADDERGARRRLERETRRSRDPTTARPRIPTWRARCRGRGTGTACRAPACGRWDRCGKRRPLAKRAPATGAARTLLIHPYAKPGETATVQIVDVLGRTESR